MISSLPVFSQKCVMDLLNVTTQYLIVRDKNIKNLIMQFFIAKEDGSRRTPYRASVNFKS